MKALSWQLTSAAGVTSDCAGSHPPESVPRTAGRGAGQGASPGSRWRAPESGGATGSETPEKLAVLEVD